MDAEPVGRLWGGEGEVLLAWDGLMSWGDLGKALVRALGVRSSKWRNGCYGALGAGL